MATALLVSTPEISLKAFPPLKLADSFVIHNTTTIQQPPPPPFQTSHFPSHHTLTLPAAQKHYSYCQDVSLYATKALISVLSHLSAFNQPDKAFHSATGTSLCWEHTFLFYFILSLIARGDMRILCIVSQVRLTYSVALHAKTTGLLLWYNIQDSRWFQICIF